MENEIVFGDGDLHTLRIPKIAGAQITIVYDDGTTDSGMFVRKAGAESLEIEIRNAANKHEWARES